MAERDPTRWGCWTAGPIPATDAPCGYGDRAADARCAGCARQRAPAAALPAGRRLAPYRLAEGAGHD